MSKSCFNPQTSLCITGYYLNSYLRDQKNEAELASGCGCGCSQDACTVTPVRMPGTHPLPTAFLRAWRPTRLALPHNPSETSPRTAAAGAAIGYCRSRSAGVCTACLQAALPGAPGSPRGPRSAGQQARAPGPGEEPGPRAGEKRLRGVRHKELFI